MTSTPNLLSQSEMDALAARLANGGGVDLVDHALNTHPDDPRLHFLRGSVLAGERDYARARAAIAHAIQLAPDYDIARFQLGFLEFTSGEPSLAAQTWEPLLSQPEDNPLRLFAEGLMCLPRDDVAGALAKLRMGISLNSTFAPLKRDMQLLIDQLSTLEPGTGEGTTEAEATSETDFLLRQFGPTTRH